MVSSRVPTVPPPSPSPNTTVIHTQTTKLIKVYYAVGDLGLVLQMQQIQTVNVGVHVYGWIPKQK